MTEYDSVKMAELVSVREEDGALILEFHNGKKVRITAAGGRLESVIS